MNIRWTLYRKIQVTIVSVLFTVFFLTQFIMVGFINQSVEKSFEANVVTTSKLLQSGIELVFNDATNSLEFINAQYEGQERDDLAFRQSFDTLVETKDYVINGFIAYEDGSFELIPDADIPGDFDPRLREWYKTAHQSRRIQWSQPYIDVATGETVITGSRHIQMENIDGVIGVDIQLSMLPDLINTTEISENGFFLLINSEGHIISDSHNQLIGQSIEALNDPTFVNSGIITGVVSTEKGMYYLRRLNRTDIRLVAFLPSIDIQSEISKILKGSIMLILVALLVGVILSYYLARRLTKPIEKLSEIMVESQEGREMVQLDMVINDELGTLINQYNNLAEHVNEQNQEMQSLSDNLMESEKKLQEQYDKVASMVYKDHLTSLPNRIMFEQHILSLIEESIEFALYYLDLDNFKYINDTYGHNYGDLVLKAISDRFAEKTNDGFFAARLSGDEFGLVVSSNFKKRDLYGFARKMLETVSMPIVINELEFSVTGSIGISIFPEDGGTFEELLSNADIAMYEAKNNLKNQYTVFNPELRKNLVNRVKIETNLYSAIEKDELFLCYQPLYTFENNKIKGFEALVRWYSEELGNVYPDVFIPIAEHNLFINQLGYYVLEQAIIFGKKLHKEYGRYYEMNVNVSTVQLHIEGFVEDVFEILNKYNYPFEYLNLEVTESVALDTNTNIHRKLSKLRRRGIKISLDDFGTGYSSINHLINLSLSHLKIDRQVIQEASVNGEVYKLIHGIVDFAHAVDLMVVAEGIEDEYMETLMKDMNVDFAQGYLYSKPVKEEFVFDLIDTEGET